MESLIRQLINLLTLYLKDKEPVEPVEVIEEPLSKNPYSVVKHVLYKDGERVRFEKTSKMGGKITGPRFTINHYTANNSLEGTIRVFKDYSVSAHLVIGRDGTVVQMIPFNRIGWHAGKSEIKSKWGTRHSGLNKYSIGLEFINYGYLGDHVKNNVQTGDWLRKIHENEKTSRKWQPYTDEQKLAAEQINAALMEAYNIPAEHLLGHDEVSPNRKVDPGPLFPMENIRNKLGARK